MNSLLVVSEFERAKKPLITTPKMRVAIVGAGASGLPATKEALEHGLEPVVFESSKDVGGVWRYKPEDSDEASVMKSTLINTSKEFTSYSTFPMPSYFANFPHNRQIMEYLRMYGDSFKFGKYLRLRHKVLDVRRAPSYDVDGKWIVKYRKFDANDNGFEGEEEFDAVLLCTGLYKRPYYPPEWPGQKQFKGKMTHARYYRDHYGYDDKTVVVVGAGNSGADIAVELSRVTKMVYLVARNGTWIVHRNLDHSVPFDIVLNTRARKFVQSRLPLSWNAWYYQNLFGRRFDHEKFGVRPKHGILSANLTLNDELPIRLCSGTVRMRPNIRKFTETGVVFDDGTEVENVDEIIFATGYDFENPIIEGGRLVPVRDNDVDLYQFMFPTELSPKNTLAVIGFIHPVGSVIPVAEMQSRLFFEAFVGSIKLPSRDGMEKHLAAMKARMHARYIPSRRHTVQTDLLPYMDELAHQIGCMPTFCKYMFTDPALFRAILFGPNVSYVYRLEGPGKWDGARDAILSVKTRVSSGMTGNEQYKRRASMITEGQLYRKGRIRDDAKLSWASKLGLVKCLIPPIVVITGALFLMKWMFN